MVGDAEFAGMHGHEMAGAEFLRGLTCLLWEHVHVVPVLIVLAAVEESEIHGAVLSAGFPEMRIVAAVAAEEEGKVRTAQELPPQRLLSRVSPRPEKCLPGRNVRETPLPASRD